MVITRIQSLAEVPVDEWDALEGGIDNPFLRHSFLAGLEQHGCVGEKWGWLPHHLIARDAGRLIGAVPLYLKYNSYGEFVFDWSWAEAYTRAGLAYYPKLVVGVPYTPATGPRILTVPGPAGELAATALIEEALALARRLDVSSLHWLFPDVRDTKRLQSAGLAQRTGCQFQWFNADYRDFDDFLERFTAQKRKKIKRERRRVQEAGIEIELYDGYQATERHWETFYHFYASTFDKLGGHATLTLDFFRHLGATQPETVVLVLARRQDRYVAGALNLRSGDTLYGRHWGCDAEFHSLHFEACYYTGIEYCIREGLQRFEPGAQGEHKVSRGFEPVATWSAHWLQNPAFSQAVNQYLTHEHEALADYMEGMRGHLPFRRDT